MTKQRGFTLIELLVVIAIIGVLSAVVLASLNTARSKGNDAAIKANLATIQVQAEMYYDTHTNSYLGVCGDPVVAAAINSARAANGGVSSCQSPAPGVAYAVSAGLSSNTSRYWCIDSTGNNTNSTTALATGVTVCPASN
ncbi:MAG: type II secretion system protein [Candidatus Paceibacterota bacterium]|jgi:prepilin-type N-terminal cleavage/methylation domain-containing protein